MINKNNKAMKTIKKNLKETLTGKHEKPEIWAKNKEFAKAVKKAYDALSYWKWVDRNDKKLNEKLYKIQEELIKVGLL